MLSAEQCRQILDDDSLSDEEIIVYRDALYAWVDRYLDDYLR